MAATTQLWNADLIGWMEARRGYVQAGEWPRYHAAIFDPPYALAFMGADWDTMSAREYQDWVTRWAELMIPYLYPGAVVAAFGGTRTFHRLAVGLEDAGLEIFDALLWVNGQGFPKGINISKAIDRAAGADRPVIGEWHKPGRGKRSDVQAYGLTQDRGTITAPATDAAARFDGYNTALKPAVEPVILARVPRGDHTFAGLATDFGTGALNIDGARIGYRPPRIANRGATTGSGMGYHGAGPHVAPDGGQGRWPSNFALVCDCEGHDHRPACPVAVLGAQSGEQTDGVAVQRNGGGQKVFRTRNTAGSRPDQGYGAGGTAERFFYVAKAAKWEREAGLDGFTESRLRPPGKQFGEMTIMNGETGDPEWRKKNPNHPRRNIHPTVKPIRMAEYIARLLLPPPLPDGPRRLFVPFGGVGSEVIGAALAGWDHVDAIEITPEYIPIHRARVRWWSQFDSYEQADAVYHGRTWEPAPEPAPEPQEGAQTLDQDGVADLPLFKALTGR